MNILILTGNMAHQTIKEYVKPFSNFVQVLKLPISIAAFISPEFVIKNLQKTDLTPFDCIIVPGLMQGSTQAIEDTFKIPTFKGPRYASDLPAILEKPLELSRTLPADKLIQDRGIEEFDTIIRKLAESEPLHLYYRIGPHRIGIDYPPLILAEIVDAPKLSLEKILAMSRYYLKKGAQMIDIGAIVGQNNAQSLRKITETVKSTLKVPVSIDSLNPEEIELAVEAGADMVLSLDAGNLKELKNLPKDRVYTIIPTNVKEGIFPRAPIKRIQLLKENISSAKTSGFTNLIIDPLLESPISPGVVRSLESMILFRKDEPTLPMLFGGGNVSELIDADSIGVNGLLACIAVELGICVILTTEYSVKTRRSVEELSNGIKMAFFANYKKRSPTGLPFHLLRAKNKKRYDQEVFDKPTQIISATDIDESYMPDSKGYFKIWVDHETELISALCYQKSNPHILIQGQSAEIIGKKIIQLNLIEDKTHILYIGRELERAEIALYLGKSYVQDLKFAEVL
ncbi:MAG: dihydropteroate synthase-like protein [Candidatus Helarchaeota archaeon]|nr:dihydropteroate synthase-like protein [Candidatus Helarchaeota archaeon]